MKNYKVEAIMKFTDKEENIKRVPYDKNLSESENEEKGSIFYCTKERYEFLKKNNAVKLIEVIEEIVNNIVDEIVESKEINEIIDKVVDETIEKVFKEKPKKKKSSKK